MKLAVVGKPSSGKTTFLNAACLTEAEMAAYPFTTIKPNKGTAYLRMVCPCAAMEVSCNARNSKCVNGIRLVPVAMIDTAGLVPEAHTGKGMGNQFLADAMDADCLIHVIDASGTTDSEGQPTKAHDPADDVAFLKDEIEQWMFGILKKDWQTLTRKIEMKTVKISDAVYDKFSGLNLRREDVEAVVKQSGVTHNSSDEDLLNLVRKIRAKAKPIVLAANKIDLPNAKENAVRINGMPVFAMAELALRQMADKQLIEYNAGDADFKVVGDVSEQQKGALEKIRGVMQQFKGTGVQAVINRCFFDILNVIVVYPVEDENKWADKKGAVLPDAIILPKGSTALDLAAKIHTDLAEQFKGAVDCKTHRKIGKDTELKNGDVIKILI